MQTPIIASEFLKFDIENNKILAQEGRAFLFNLNNKKACKKSNLTHNVDHNCLNFQENWMGKNKNGNDDINIIEVEKVEPNINSQNEIEVINTDEVNDIIKTNNDILYINNSFNLRVHSTPDKEHRITKSTDVDIENDLIFESIISFNDDTMRFIISDIGCEIEMDSTFDFPQANVIPVPMKEYAVIQESKEILIIEEKKINYNDEETLSFNITNDHNYSKSPPKKKGTYVTSCTEIKIHHE